MTSQEIAEMVKAALRHADQTDAPIHRLSGPSDKPREKGK